MPLPKPHVNARSCRRRFFSSKLERETADDLEFAIVLHLLCCRLLLLLLLPCRLWHPALTDTVQCNVYVEHEGSDKTRQLPLVSGPTFQRASHEVTPLSRRLGLHHAPPWWVGVFELDLQMISYSVVVASYSGSMVIVAPAAFQVRAEGGHLLFDVHGPTYVRLTRYEVRHIHTFEELGHCGCLWPQGCDTNGKGTEEATFVVAGGVNQIHVVVGGHHLRV